MKKGWETKKLGDVATLQRGFDLPTQDRVSGVYPLVSSSGVSDTHYKSAVPGPGVVTGRSGSIGNVFFIEEDFWPLNTVLYIKDFHGNDPRFVYHLLRHFDLKRFATGTGVPTLNRNFVHDELVIIPTSVAEQKRIVGLLDEAFEGLATAKANAEKNLANARALLESHLQSVFTHRREGWVETTLGDEVEFAAGFAFKSTRYVRDPEIGMRLLRGDNIMQGEFRWESAAYWPSGDTVAYQRFRLAENDIVLAMDRPWVTAGLKLARVSAEDLPCLQVQRTARLRVAARLSWRYLFHLLRSQGFVDYLLDGQTGLAVPHISGKQILAFQFFLPSLPQQKVIADQLDALAAETQRLESLYVRKLAALEALKKSLLHQAFSGNL